MEVNRKRDVELQKLRKLLEDVHLESEETAHLLKKKHQEIVIDFNEQIESLSKARSRYVYMSIFYYYKIPRLNERLSIHLLLFF